MKKKGMKYIVFNFGLIVLAIIVRYIAIFVEYKSIMSTNPNVWSVTQHPFYHMSEEKEFYIEDTQLDLKLWWKGLTGEVEVIITDDAGNICFDKKAKNMDNVFKIPMAKGNYKMKLSVTNFTGALALGYDNMIEVINLSENYTLIPWNPEGGFYWDYLLYIPDEIKNNYLLVIPNNTGNVYDNIEFHRAKAKETILWKSSLADKLGVPLLVPVFPRPRAQAELYTHALNRTALLTQMIELKRLDLQLIAMTEDARNILKGNEISIDEHILMWGFSASGDFVDRFTFLHPEMVKAAALGGCDNMLPLSNYNGENLPYPAGTYDYKAITNKEFDKKLFTRIERYIYKGSEDEGGWQTIEEDGESVTYTAKDYFEKYEMHTYLERQNHIASPLYTEGDLSEEIIKELLFRSFEGKCYIDRFDKTKLIFQELGFDNNKFVRYESMGHEITDRVEEDVLNFFSKVLKFGGIK